MARSEVTLEQRVEAAEMFDMSRILARYCKDYDVPMSLALEQEIELKRYLILCAQDPAASYGMRGCVDDLWHTFLLFTKDYMDFCYELKSHFIHHVPNDPGEAPSPGPSTYAQFLDRYKDAYKSDPPIHIWPKPAGGISTLGCSHGGCGPCSKGCGNNCHPSCG